MEIVPPENIPAAVDVQPHGLMAAYDQCRQMCHVCDAHGGIALVAVQVGLPLKLFVAKTDGGEYGFFANCSYTPCGAGTVASVEGCLSLRDKRRRLRRYCVERCERVRVVGKRLVAGSDAPYLEDYDETHDGLFAVVLQHEIDHQNRVLISDIGREIQLRA